MIPEWWMIVWARGKHKARRHCVARPPYGLCPDRFFELTNGLNMRFRCAEVGIHGIHRQVRGSKSSPRLRLLCPDIRRAVGDVNAGFHADVGWVASCFPGIIVQPGDCLMSRVVRLKGRKPAIAQPRHAKRHAA